MAANVLGRAYIEVHADTKPFAREMESEVLAVTKLVEKEAKVAGQKVGKNLGDGIEKESKRAAPRIANGLIGGIRTSFTRAASRSRGIFSALIPNFRRSGRSAVAGVGEEIGEDVTRGIANGIAEGASTVTGSLASLVKSIGSSVGNVGSNGPFAAVLGGLIVAGIPALIGAVISLVSALSGLLYLLLLIPGAIAGLAAAIIPVVVAFKGFGEAVSAVLSKDPKRIAEAFKDLAPAARTVARQIAPLIDMFKGLSKIAQQGFFEGLVGAFNGVANVLRPILDVGFRDAAVAAGEFAASLVRLVENPQVQKFFSASFQFAAQLFEVLGPPMLNFITALAALATESYPTLLELFGMLGGVLNRFAEWIQKSIANEDFDRFMDKMLKALDNVGRLLGSTGGLIKALLGGPQQRAEAQGFFDDLIELIDTLSEFFRSADGRKALDGMIQLAKIFLLALLAVSITAFEIVAAFQLIYELLVKIVELATGLRIGDRNLIERRAGSGTNTGSGSSVSHGIGHAQGGVFDQEHLARIAEGGKREVILPMTDPARARDIANRAGVSAMLDAGTQINVYIGDEQVMARVDKRVGAAFKQFGRQMKFGPRTVGAGA